MIRDGNVVSPVWGLNRVAENVAKIILLYGCSMICSSNEIIDLFEIGKMEKD